MTSSPITTSFGFDSTAAEVIAGIDLTGRRAIVTGGSSGIGIETARALAGAGGRTAAQIIAATANPAVRVGRLDLADPASVAAFAAGWSGPLHLLISNAGVMALPGLQLTPQGWEVQFATNHLGHFALATGLHDALAAAGDARVVSLSSRGHLRSPVVFDDLSFAARAYDPWLAYGQSKTANVLFAVEATRRWAGDGITANAVHPGAIATNLPRHMTAQELASVRAASPAVYKTVGQGAATSVLVATSPQLKGIGGRYFEDCHEAAVLPAGAPSSSPSGVAAYAVDPDAAARLWRVSADLLAG
jgi:NAD(P)-dependent dehydrogenase (short-subunit alcohol dehydrogenase family)